MSRRRISPHAPLLFLLVAFLLLAAETDEQNQAGLVVDFGDGQVETVCIGFSEAEITGFDLLQRSGLALEFQAQGLGAAVCRIDDTGCPANICFCQCRGDECVYWSYWQQGDGIWEYAAAGAGASRVMPGEVEGWSWGPGSVTEAIPPATISFAEICSASTLPTPVESQAITEGAGTETNPSPVLYGLLGVLFGVLVGVLVLGFLVMRRAQGNQQ